MYQIVFSGPFPCADKINVGFKAVVKILSTQTYTISTTKNIQL